MFTESMTYVARCICSGAVMMRVDSPDRTHDVARDVSRVIKAGYPVERMTTEQAREQPFCKNRGKCVSGSVMA